MAYIETIAKLASEIENYIENIVKMCVASNNRLIEAYSKLACDFEDLKNDQIDLKNRTDKLEKNSGE